MTTSQISKILVSDLGFKMNEEIDLKNAVSSISTSTDCPIYPDKNTRLKFVSKNAELLEIYSGHEEEKDGKIIFIKSPEKPINYYSFSAIISFNLLSLTKVSEPYKYRRTL